MAVLLAACGSAAAGGFAGVVTHVSDGDTLWVRPQAGGAPRQIRIEGMDAPEICQPFGTQARDALAARVLRRQVTVRGRARDSYRRILGRVSLEGEDLGSWMVGHGHAWSSAFRGDPGPYAKQQAQAQGARLGLWRGASPTPPREFRKQHGSCRQSP